MACLASCCAANPRAPRSQSKTEEHTQRSATGLFPPRSNFISRTNQIMQWLKSIFIGRARNLSDERLFHKIWFVAVLAWVGLARMVCRRRATDRRNLQGAGRMQRDY